VKQVARELGVRYVLEGSVRKAGRRKASREEKARGASALTQTPFNHDPFVVVNFAAPLIITDLPAISMAPIGAAH
jgi:hypothetical protein